MVEMVMFDALQAGDRLVMRTTHSVYEMWMEFPDRAMGVLRGGHLPSPSRVRITAESATSSDVMQRPLRVGERARVVVVGPNREPTRCFVTSRILSIAIDSSKRAAA
jgi:hypothetical protein